MKQLHLTSQPTLLEILGLFTGSLILFTWGLSGEEIIGFESRFYLFAQEMWRYGASFFPTTYQQPYPDYPATSTVLIYLASLSFGVLNKFTAVLPSAMAASITVTLTYLIGALKNKRLGWCAVFLMVLTIAFLKNARSLSLDMYTTLITTWCFYLIYAADIKHKPSLVKWIYPLLLLAFAFRGPIGLVMPTGVICAYYLLDGRIRPLLVVGLSSLGLLILCALSLLALAYHVGGYTFMEDVLRMEVLGRMETSSLPRYFYWVDGLTNYALSFPLACLTLLGLCYNGIKTCSLSSEQKFLLKLAGWMMVILIGMSIPGDKKTRYVLPMVPAIALLAAYLFVAPSKESYFVYGRRFLLGLLSLFPLLFLVMLSLALPYARQWSLAVPIPGWPIFAFFIILQLLCFLGMYCYAKRPQHITTVILFIAALSFAVLHIAVIEPVEIHIDRAHDFVVQIEKERTKAHARLIFYKERPDGMPVKYLINMPQAEQPLFIQDEAALRQYQGPAYIITSAAYFAGLSPDVANRFRLIAKDTLGHVKVVVFTQQEE